MQIRYRWLKPSGCFKDSADVCCDHGCRGDAQNCTDNRSRNPATILSRRNNRQDLAARRSKCAQNSDLALRWVTAMPNEL